MICDKINVTTDLQELVKQSMDFDVVIANPPYQGNTKSSGNTIWDKFVATSLETSERWWFYALHQSSSLAST